jgi:uncharacterized protein YdhG (YjbR/CyaY superfamily)
MPSSADALIAALPDDRKEPIKKLRSTIKKNLPKGFEETVSSGMINWVVPHKTYPDGYHCDPKQPLPFLSLASQKNNISLYHMGLYSDPELLKWFQDEWAKVSKRKLDMGKSCIRFKKPDEIPFDLIGQLASKMSPPDWIARYESVLKR